jgi:hypothetical protein
MKIWIFLLVAVLWIGCFPGCVDDDPSTSSGQADNSDDDDSSDDDADDDADDDSYAPLFVRPSLPINAFHMAASHNTFIWRGPPGGPTTLVASLGLIRALNLGQLFLEIDVTSKTDDGDFWVNHSETTQSVRLSSMLRNIRWWSDTHADHEMIVVGFQWGAGSDEATMNEFNALIDEFLVGTSPVSDEGPLFSLSDWVQEMTAPLDEATRLEIAALPVIELAQVLGYPSIAEMRGKVALETGGSVFSQTPSFFQLGGDGHFTNDGEEALGDIAAHTANRMAQRLTRIYTSGRVFNGNYNLFDGFRSGVSNCALNMEMVGTEHKPAYAFMDENARGYAPPGYVETVDGLPKRLGPPVFVGAFGAESERIVSLDLSFDEALGMTDAPVVIFRVVAQGIGGGTVDSIDVTTPGSTLLANWQEPAAAKLFALAAGESGATIELIVNGNQLGYEVHVVGPTVSNVVIVGETASAQATLWTSPTFRSINLETTGACATLAARGERLFGQLAGQRCEFSENPSFLVEMKSRP